jgi:hypothetical protein
MVLERECGRAPVEVDLACGARFFVLLQKRLRLLTRSRFLYNRVLFYFY